MKANVNCLRSVILMLLATFGCEPRPAVVRRSNPPQSVHVAAAQLLTDRYARSPLANWHVHASAADSDCGVLLVEVSIILDDSMVEAMHYGAGVYDVYGGGLQRFSRDRAFRAVAYKDASGRFWTYDRVSASEAPSLIRCR